jgi:hypothetical protein
MVAHHRPARRAILERGDWRGARSCVGGDRGLALAPAAQREIIELVAPIRLSSSAAVAPAPNLLREESDYQHR